MKQQQWIKATPGQNRVCKFAWVRMQRIECQTAADTEHPHARINFTSNAGLAPAALDAVADNFDGIEID